jgi:phosphoglucomutase
MKKFRNYSEKNLVGNDILEIKDYLLDGTGLPKSDVLGFILKGGNQVYLRPSGTEPKIKFYIMIQEKNGSLIEKKQAAQSKTTALLNYLKVECEKA